METRIIESIIDITQARDVDTLERVLLQTVAELVPVSSVTLVQLMDDFRFDACDTMLTLSVCDQAAGEHLITDQVRDLEPNAELTTAIQECITQVRHNSDEITVYVPIQGEQRATNVLLLEGSDEKMLEQLNVLNGLARIYGNFLLVLDDSQRDKLTGLLNRRTFDKKLKHMMELQRKMAEDYAGPVANRRLRESNANAWLAVVDIDHFKRINDSHGHIYGDEVILSLGHRMKQFFRNSDLLFRFGGEEFVVVLEPMSLTQARTALGRFRESVAEHIFPQIGGITVSIGFDRIRDNDYPAIVVDRADKALYFAKQNGRNQVACYEQLVESGRIEPSEFVGSIDLF